MTQPENAGDRNALGLIATLVSVAAFLIAALGLVIIATNDSGTTASSSGGSSSAPVPVALSEFKITPQVITAAPGDVKLAVTNNGTMVHNLSVVDLKKTTKDLQPGASETLDLGDLKAGSTYKVICTIPGHESSGMVAQLTIAEGTSSGGGSQTATAGASAGMNNPTPAEAAAMNARMAAGMEAGLKAFTADPPSTKGKGNTPLLPTTVEADGTKVFDIEAKIIDWEVSPGKIVKAWTYNNQVPGPWIRTEPNDKVKLNVKNALPTNTDVHLHGISVPNDMDGVAYITQKPIEPGQTFTYSWTNANRNELGMYHAHEMGQVSVVNGLFGVFQVGDVPLPAGKTTNGVPQPANLKVTQELPIVLNDAGTIGLSLNGKSYPGTAPVASNPGDTLEVHYYNEGLLAHPMHLHGVDQLVIAKDGFALAEPYYVDTVTILPGERYTVLIQPTTQDLGKDGAPGVWAWHCHILNHAENDDGLFGMVTALLVVDPNAKK